MTNDMTKGNPGKHILYFSIPILLGSIFQQLYSMADTIIVGKCLGTNALAAVGLTGALSYLILGFIMGMTSGFSVVTSQCFGANEPLKVRKSLATSIVLSIISSIIITILALVITKPMLRIMNTPADIFDTAYTYISIIFLGIICTMIYNFASCVLRALGDSKTPLYFLIISSVLNILLDLLFIRPLGMGVAGAALATVMAQGVSGILCIWYARKKCTYFTLSREDFRITRKDIIKHLEIGVPMAFQYSVTAIGVILLQSALNLFGPAKIAAFTAASKVEQLVAQPAATLGATLSTYTSQNLGAHKPKRIQKGVNISLLFSLFSSILAALVVVLLGPSLTGLFISGSQQEVLDSAQIYLNLLAISYPFLNLLFIFRSTLQGMGKSMVCLISVSIELVSRCVVAFILPIYFGFKGICMASPIAWFLGCIPIIPAYLLVMKKLNKLR